VHTFGLPAIIVRPSNNYGPWQFPEKLIPVIISRSLKDQYVPVYGKGRQIREWLHVADCAKGIILVLEKGKPGEIYNIGSCFEQKNIDTVKKILRFLGKRESLIRFVPDRPGHDYRYSVNCAKIRQLGWRPGISFVDGIKNTIAWYKSNS
jgi:dTDP-glucose 4,6-dehydratase